MDVLWLLSRILLGIVSAIFLGVVIVAVTCLLRLGIAIAWKEYKIISILTVIGLVVWLIVT